LQQASGDAVQQQEPSPSRRTQPSLIRNETWVNDKKVITEGSPEMQQFRAELKTREKPVGHNTSICFHLERRIMAEGKEVISITTQGTLANYNTQNKILDWVEDYLVIDGQRVVIGAPHDNDHSVFSNIAEVCNLPKDRGLTIKLPRELHLLRTHNPELNSLRFDLNKLTDPLHRILQPVQAADKALWRREEHAYAINKFGLTPEFLVNQYAFAHNSEVARMTHDLRENKKFHGKQATAYLVDGMIESSITLSTNKFIYYEPTPPMLEDEDESVLSRFTSYQVEKANQCYFKKVRLHNLSKITKHFSNYTKLAHTLELYSQSPEGLGDGCNPFQTDQHRETKMKAICSFKKVLKGGGIPERETKEALDDMLGLAAVDKDGNSTEGLLPIEEVKDRIYTIGEPLNINYLYKRRSVYSMMDLKKKVRREYYKECVKNAATKPGNASIVLEQESSDQDFIFLD
jgi:hypothetical protein